MNTGVLKDTGMLAVTVRSLARRAKLFFSEKIFTQMDFVPYIIWAIETKI